MTSSKEHTRDAESKANAQSGLLTTLSNNLGTADAAYVMDKKVVPHALYGLEASWADDKSLAQLDDTVTGRCIFRAYGLPITSRKSVRMYQSRSLHASRQIRLSCVRFVAKLARDTDPIRKVLVQQQLTARTPPPQIVQTCPRGLCKGNGLTRRQPVLTPPQHAHQGPSQLDQAPPTVPRQ